MSYKDLLVVLGPDTASRGRIELAAALAERSAAHLVGLYPLPVPDAPRHLGYYDPALLDPFFRELREKAQDAGDKEREAFEHAAGLRGLSTEWRVAEVGAESDAALHARLASTTRLLRLRRRRSLDALPIATRLVRDLCQGVGTRDVGSST